MIIDLRSKLTGISLTFDIDICHAPIFKEVKEGWLTGISITDAASRSI